MTANRLLGDNQESEWAAGGRSRAVSDTTVHTVHYLWQCLLLFVVFSETSEQKDEVRLHMQHIVLFGISFFCRRKLTEPSCGSREVTSKATLY